MSATLRERMARDPVFVALVQMFLHAFETQCGSGAGVTPTEVREASGYAWQIYLERNVPPVIAIPRDGV